MVYAFVEIGGSSDGPSARKDASMYAVLEIRDFSSYVNIIADERIFYSENLNILKQGKKPAIVSASIAVIRPCLFLSLSLTHTQTHTLSLSFHGRRSYSHRKPGLSSQFLLCVCQAARTRQKDVSIFVTKDESILYSFLSLGCCMMAERGVK